MTKSGLTGRRKPPLRSGAKLSFVPALVVGVLVYACMPATPAATTPPAAGPFAPFGTVELQPQFILDGEGENIDSLAFWEADDPAETRLYVTAKDNELVEVWREPFVDNEEPPLRHESFGMDSAVNGVVINQETDELFVSVARPRSTVAVFSLPSLEFKREYHEPDTSLGIEPNLGLLHHPDGPRLYVTASDDVYVRLAETGELIVKFRALKGLETIVADEHRQLVLIPDEAERTGVYAYDPDGTPYPTERTSRFGTSSFQSDAEGILIYTCPADGDSDDGRGFIVVADQVAEATEFEFFDRQSWQHLGTMRLAGVNNTDGIASTQRPRPGYPVGLFVAVDDDESVAGIGWSEILTATALGC